MKLLCLVCVSTLILVKSGNSRLWGLFRGHCYTRILTQGTYAESLARCQEIGAYPAEPKNVAELNFIFDNLQYRETPDDRHYAVFFIGLDYIHGTRNFTWKQSSEFLAHTPNFNTTSCAVIIQGVIVDNPLYSFTEIYSHHPCLHVNSVLCEKDADLTIDYTFRLSYTNRWNYCSNGVYRNVTDYEDCVDDCRAQRECIGFDFQLPNQCTFLEYSPNCSLNRLETKWVKYQILNYTCV